jgi:NADH:ubiquinone reductase (H+-translocating)
MRLMQYRHTSRVVILGAGYAGISAMHALKQFKNASVTMVDRHPYHTLVTELHEAAAHNKDVTISLEPMLRGVKFFPAEVQRVDLDARVIHTNHGALEFDQLIIALGSSTNFYRIPGLAEHALELKSTEDAEAIYSRFTAMHHRTREVQHVVIGGAGLTGVELATELAVRTEELAREFDALKVQIHLVEAGEQILPALESTLRQRAEHVLEARGVKVHLGRRIMSAETGSVQLDDGTILESTMTIWTGGVRAADIVQGAHLERGVSNRIVVNADLSLPHYPGVYAAGDMALARDIAGNPVAPTAQNAGHQGRIAAQNLIAHHQGQTTRAYQPNLLGELVSLGGWLGVGWMQLPMGKRLKLIGALASLVKRASVWKHVVKARGWA